MRAKAFPPARQLDFARGWCDRFRMPEAAAVRTMFAGISRRYDLANHVLSGGLDFVWRRRLTKMVAATRPRSVADLATGSGDVAFALKRRLGAEAAVEGYDFCEPMLEEARSKGARSPLTAAVPFRHGDCLNLDIPSDSFDAVTIAFGLRNLEDRHRGLCEMRRVLRPGGHLFVLEFTQPERWFRPVYYLYLKSVLPVLAWALCRNRSAYDYLAGSIEDFPSKESLSHELEAAGFEPVCATGLHASIVALHRGMKPICESRT